MPDVYKEALSKENATSTPVPPYVTIPSFLLLLIMLIISVRPLPSLQEAVFQPHSTNSHETESLWEKLVKFLMETMSTEVVLKPLFLPTLIQSMLLSKKPRLPS